MKSSLDWRDIWRRVFSRRQMEADIDDEISFHLEGVADALAEYGLSEDQARREARRRFGDLDRIRADMASASGARLERGRREEMVHALARDLKHALRGFARRPGFALIVSGILALGIGANTAVFSVLNSVILAPLPYDGPDRLMRILQIHEENDYVAGWVTGPAFLDYQEMGGGLEHVVALDNHNEKGLTLTGRGLPQRVTMLPVTTNYFDAYRVEPLFGRSFAPEEQAADARVVVLSHRLWASIASEGESLLGEQIRLDDVAHQVIGVLPPSFKDVLGGDVDLWSPVDLERVRNGSRGSHFLTVFARLEPGATREEVQGRLDALSAQQAEAYPRPHEGWSARLIPLHDDVAGDVGTALYLLMAAAGIVLLIAAVNVTSLFLARNMARERELAVRSALGSGRARLFRQLLVESLLLAGVGGILGTFLAYWGVGALLSLAPESFPRAFEVTPDATFLLFALAIILLTGFISGALPAHHLSRVDPGKALRKGGRTSTTGGGVYRLQDLLLATQIGAALVLLIGAGLLMGSFLNLRGTDLGIAARSVSSFRVHLPEARFGDPAERAALHINLQERLESLSGFQEVGAISWLPVSGEYHDWGFRYTPPGGEPVFEGAQFRVIEGGYFQALGIGLTLGRLFDRQDNADAPPVALVNGAFVDAFYRGHDPLSEEIPAEGRLWQVVGVVGNVAHDHRGTMAPKVYLPHAQFADNRNWELAYVVAGTVPRQELFGVIRQELQALDPDLIFHETQSLEEVMASAIARETFTSFLMAIFSGLAVVLAAAGIYGMLSFAVTRRNREIGIRAALGAQPGQVRASVVRRHSAPVAIGFGAGLIAALALTRVLSSMLFGIGAKDPLVFVGSLTVLAVVAGLAGYLPLRRATRVDPIETLRAD